MRRSVSRAQAFIPGGSGRRVPGRGPTNAVVPNMLNRTFTASAANRKWVADFTDHWTAKAWLYVAAVVDLFSRRVVGWSMSATMTAQLVTDALVMVIWRWGQPEAICITLIGQPVKK